MSDIPDDDILALYGSLMAEVKARVDYVANAAGQYQHGSDGTANQFELEGWYLQLRRVCELVALAVLTAHSGDPAFIAGLADKPHADYLLGQLGKLSIDAVPQQAMFLEVDDTLFAMVPNQNREEFREAIRALYVHCNNVLHAGHLNFLRKFREKEVSMNYINTHISLLTERLDQHAVILPNQRVMLARMEFRLPRPVACQWLDPSGPGLTAPPGRCEP